MTEIVAASESFDDGSAYGTILLDDGKDVGYGSGPWAQQHALLYAINEGLLNTPNSNVRVHLDRPQIANYMKTGLIERWKQNDWTKMNGSDIGAVDQWRHLLSFSEEKNIDWVPESDHELMPWARRCALCAIGGVPITSLQNTSEIETVNNAQAGYFWQEVKESGFTDQAARRLLADYNVISAKDIPKVEFDSVMERASSPAIGKKYAKEARST